MKNLKFQISNFKFIVGILAAIFFIWPHCILAQSAKAPLGTPTRAIQDLDAKLDDYKTGPNLTPEDKEYNRQLKKDILNGTFDVRELSKLALAKHWDQRTPKEQDDFVQLMKDLLENKAILSKEQGQKKAKSENVYSVSYKGDKFLNADKSRALTKTSVYVKSEDIRVELNYKLKIESSVWKIFDVIVDGASLLDNYKYQFDSIITKNGYPELVRRMSKKLNSMTNGKPADTAAGGGQTAPSSAGVEGTAAPKEEKRGGSGCSLIVS